MLISIHRGYVEQYDGGQDAIVHLVCSVQGLAKLGRFAVINRHPITALAEQFDDLAALADLDWTIMRAKYWSDTDEDGDRNSAAKPSSWYTAASRSRPSSSSVRPQTLLPSERLHCLRGCPIRHP